jgi:hypothetical protein
MLTALWSLGFVNGMFFILYYGIAFFLSHRQVARALLRSALLRYVRASSRSRLAPVRALRSVASSFQSVASSLRFSVRVPTTQRNDNAMTTQ